MNPWKSFLILGSAMAWVHSTDAAISVTGSGAGPFNFSTAPARTDFSTLSVAGSSGTFESVAAIDTAIIQAADAASITNTLGTTGTVPPSANAFARHNTTLLWLQTMPAGNSYTLLMATLANDTGGTIHSFRLTYDFMAANLSTAIPLEAIPGHRVFWSATGAPGSWVLIQTLSGLGATNLGASGTVSGISWPAGANAFILWADDNSVGTDWGNTIDNLAIADVQSTEFPSLAISYDSGIAKVTISWVPAGGTLEYTDALTSPPTSIVWNSIPGATSPYTGPVSAASYRYFRVTVP